MMVTPMTVMAVPPHAPPKTVGTAQTARVRQFVVMGSFSEMSFVMTATPKQKPNAPITSVNALPVMPLAAKWSHSMAGFAVTTH